MERWNDVRVDGKRGIGVGVTIVIPTFNEAGNVAELVRRASAAKRGTDTEILFVDDSTDGTDDEVRRVARTADLPVRVIHRDEPVHGLGGAVVAGFRAAAHTTCVVMDGDLQHPPEKIPELVERVSRGDVDLVAASRGDSRGEGEGEGGAGAGGEDGSVNGTITGRHLAEYVGA